MEIIHTCVALHLRQIACGLHLTTLWQPVLKTTRSYMSLTIHVKTWLKRPEHLPTCMDLTSMLGSDTVPALVALLAVDGLERGNMKALDRVDDAVIGRDDEVPGRTDPRPDCEQNHVQISQDWPTYLLHAYSASEVDLWRCSHRQLYLHGRGVACCSVILTHLA